MSELVSEWVSESLINYRVFQYLSPPFHSQTGQWYIWKLYIFRTLYQFQITMQVFRAIAQFTYFRSYGLCVKVKPIFTNIFWLYFWGDFPKMAMKSSIIGLDSYIIPHFKANMSWYASVSQQHLFYKRVLCEYRLNRSKVMNWKSDFRKNRAIPKAPPTQQNWEIIDIKQQLYN